MKVLHLVAAAIMLGAMSVATPAGPRVLELTYEASGSMVSLPSTSTGELTFQACDKCKTLRLRASETSTYFLGEQQVSLAELRQYLSSYPETFLVVMRHKDTFNLSRVVVPGPKRAR